MLIHWRLHGSRSRDRNHAGRPNFRQRRIVAFTAASCHAKSAPNALHCGDLHHAGRNRSETPGGKRKFRLTPSGAA